MLQETQLRKVHMEGNSLERLLDLAGSRDKLPKLLGGRSTTHAIPQTGFLGRNAFLLLCEDGATQADIKAGGTLQLPFRMSANDTLCWEYVVKDRDISFAVKFRTQGIGGAEESEKVAPERVSSGAPSRAPSRQQKTARWCCPGTTRSRGRAGKPSRTRPRWSSRRTTSHRSISAGTTASKALTKGV